MFYVIINKHIIYLKHDQCTPGLYIFFFFYFCWEDHKNLMQAFIKLYPICFKTLKTYRIRSVFHLLSRCQPKSAITCTVNDLGPTHCDPPIQNLVVHFSSSDLIFIGLYMDLMTRQITEMYQ